MRCFQLFRRGINEPCDLNKVDEELCAMLGYEVHPDKYVCAWFDSIGFRIALGDELGSDKLRKELAEYEDLTKILNYLEDNFTSASFYESSYRKSG